MGKKIISYCLWGDNEMYYRGALKNIQLAKKLLPEFVCRFYVPKDFDLNKIKTLKNESEVFVVDDFGSSKSMMWRFLPLEEDSVDVLLSRDCDSRIGLREQYTVNEWLNTDKKLHIIRDHPFHDVLMLGGMWGIKNKKIKVESLINLFKQTKLYKDEKNCDQLFLWNYIYPLFDEDDILRHDDFFGGTPIPISRYADPYTFFIGQPMDTDQSGNDFELYPRDRQDLESRSKQ